MVQKSLLTLPEAFDMVGRGMFEGTWIGQVIGDGLHPEANAQERPSPARAKKMVATGRGLSHWPNPDSQEYLDQYEAWCRRQGAEMKIREIMSSYDIESLLRDPVSGNADFDLEQSHWEPHHKNFWINPSSGHCGFCNGGPDSGDCRIDRLPFEKVVKALFGKGRPKKSVREERKAKTINKYEVIFEIVTRKKEERPELRGKAWELARAVAAEYNQNKIAKEQITASSIRRRLYDHYPDWPK